LANFSIGHAQLIDPSYLRMTGIVYVMGRNEASICELFYRSCTADKSFVPQDDRKIGYIEYPSRNLKNNARRD
jgi:hypothetical protein